MHQQCLLRLPKRLLPAPTPFPFPFFLPRPRRPQFPEKSTAAREARRVAARRGAPRGRRRRVPLLLVLLSLFLLVQVLVVPVLALHCLLFFAIPRLLPTNLAAGCGGRDRRGHGGRRVMSSKMICE